MRGSARYSGRKTWCVILKQALGIGEELCAYE
jgi:hypothetical protein